MFHCNHQLIEEIDLMYCQRHCLHLTTMVRNLFFLILARHAKSLHSTENTISNSACRRYHGCMFRSPYDPRSQKETYLNGGSISRYSSSDHGVVRRRYAIVVLTTNNTVSFFCPVVEMQQRLTGVFLPEMLLVPTGGSVRTPYDGRPTTSSPVKPPSILPTTEPETT